MRKLKETSQKAWGIRVTDFQDKLSGFPPEANWTSIMLSLSTSKIQHERLLQQMDKPQPRSLQTSQSFRLRPNHIHNTKTYQLLFNKHK